MENDSSYLKKLRFERKLKDTWVAKFLSNPRIFILLLVSVITVGVASYVNLPRRLNPEVDIPLVIVTTVLPGASPQSVESLITVPLENEIRSIENISTVTSSSQNSFSIIQVEFTTGTDPDGARDDVQSEISSVVLPEDAQIPSVQKIDFENQPIWTFSIISKSDFGSLSRFAKNLKNDLEELTSIDSVSTGGLEEQEVSIIINPSRATSYNISTAQLLQLVTTSLSSFPAGVLKTDNSSFTLSIDPTVASIEDIRNLKLNVNGSIVPLSSIALISERSKPSTLSTYFASSSEAATRTIVFNVFKTSTANINAAFQDAEEKVNENLSEYNNIFEVKTISNTNELIDEQFGDLTRDFGITIVLVFVSLFIFLGARQAFIAFFSIPLTFLISFAVMNFLGISLNFLSMFSLLLSLGLLVDDTIVVISAMTSYYRTKKFSPFETGLLVWRDFIVPVLTTTLTTVWAFLPLLLSTGIIGEFIKSIPIVVSSTLIASFFVAMFLTLPAMVILLKPQLPQRVVRFFQIGLILGLVFIFITISPKGIFLPFALIAFVIASFVMANVYEILGRNTKKYIAKQQKQSTTFRKMPSYFDNGVISFQTIERIYRRIIKKILSTKQNRRKAVVMVVAFSLFSYLLLPLGFVKNEFFPSSDENNLYITLELPPGTNSEVSDREAQKILSMLRISPDISYMTADIGQSFDPNQGFIGAGENTVLFSLSLPERHERKRSSMEMARDLRKGFQSYTTGKITVTEISGGPPAGADIQIKLFGEDLALLDSYADKVAVYLGQQAGVADISKSIKEGTSKLSFVPDQTAMAEFNLTNDSLGLLLRTFASGLTLTESKITGEMDEEQDITLRFGQGKQKVEDIYVLSVPTPLGNVSLARLGQLELRPNPTLITRENGQRTISVSATVTEGPIPEVNKDLEEFAKTQLNLPEGYSWGTGGVNEENQNSVNSILTAMLLSFLLILITMVIQFSSFRKALIVMLVIPLSISGVFIIFAIANIPLSFPALIGMLALFGIVVKNSILIVDKITANEKTGMNFLDSIVDATESRLEPIALTSFATIFGLTAITLSDPLWRGLGGAIIAGLTFSGTIMLFFIPVVYYMWMNKEKGKR